MEKKFYRCPRCGQVVECILPGSPLVCCGLQMKELVPGETDGAVEKHVPSVKREGNVVTVQVGSVEHPMTEPHFIQFIAVSQGKKSWRADLTPEDKPVATFAIDEGPATVYEFCNLHGFWKAEIE